MQLSHLGELEFELCGADKLRKVPHNTKVFLREKQILAKVTLIIKKKTGGNYAFFGDNKVTINSQKLFTKHIINNVWRLFFQTET